MAMQKWYTPKIDEVYPSFWNKTNNKPQIASFKYLDDLQLTRKMYAVRFRDTRDAQYIVGADFRVRIRVHYYTWRSREGYEGATSVDRTITVPKGFLTDLASVPRILWPIIGPVGPHLEASIVHDFLYVAWQDLHMHPQIDYFNFANDVFFAGLLAARVDGRKIQMMDTAVRNFGWDVFKEPNSPPRYILLD